MLGLNHEEQSQSSWFIWLIYTLHSDHQPRPEYPHCTPPPWLLRVVNKDLLDTFKAGLFSISTNKAEKACSPLWRNLSLFTSFSHSYWPWWGKRTHQRDRWQVSSLREDDCSLLHLYTALQMTPDGAEIQPNSNISCVAWKSSQNGLKTFREWRRQSNIWYLNNQIGVGGDLTRARSSTVNTAVTVSDQDHNCKCDVLLDIWIGNYLLPCSLYPLGHTMPVFCFHGLQFAIEITYCNLMLFYCNSSSLRPPCFPLISESNS